MDPYCDGQSDHDYGTGRVDCDPVSKGANASCCNCLTPRNDCTTMWVLIDIKVENDLLMLLMESVQRLLIQILTVFSLEII